MVLVLKVRTEGVLSDRIPPDLWDDPLDLSVATDGVFSEKDIVRTEAVASDLTLLAAPLSALLLGIALSNNQACSTCCPFGLAIHV